MEVQLLGRLADVALTLAIMGYFLWELNKKNERLSQRNDDLVEKMHLKDLENIKTLEAISKTIDKLGTENVKEIKNHISERTADIKNELQRYGK